MESSPKLPQTQAPAVTAAAATTPANISSPPAAWTSSGQLPNRAQSVPAADTSRWTRVDDGKYSPSRG